MKKLKLMGLLGVTLTMVMGIAFIGCDQPNGSMADETDTIQAAAIDTEPAVRARGLRTNREFTRDGFIRARPENRRPGAEGRRLTAPDGSSERRAIARAAYGTENPGVRGRRTSISREEWLQRRESRRSPAVVE